MLAHLNVEKSAFSHFHKHLRSEHSNHFSLFHVTQGDTIKGDFKK